MKKLRMFATSLFALGIGTIGIACNGSAGAMQPTPEARNTAPVTANAPAPTESQSLLHFIKRVIVSVLNSIKNHNVINYKIIPS